MPTPPKPISVIKSEGKSHVTKKQIQARQEAEKATLSGVAIKERPEVKNNAVAHKEFLRVTKLLNNLDKNDAVYEPVINRYCLIQAECTDLEEQKEHFYALVKKLKESWDNDLDELEPEIKADYYLKYIRELVKLQNGIIKLDGALQTKRRMLFDIEKENIMTIAAALRSIPKKEEVSEDPLLKALRGG